MKGIVELGPPFSESKGRADSMLLRLSFWISVVLLMLTIFGVVFNEFRFGETEQDVNRSVVSLNAVEIGNQHWAAQNLSVEYFRNGDKIPEAKTAEEWVDAAQNKQPAWCYYQNKTSFGTQFGKLYNWYAVNDPRGLAPEGWHVPSYDEWVKLKDHFSGSLLADKLKSKSDWAFGGNGTNEAGFTGLPGGQRKSDGSFDSRSLVGFFWSTSEYDGNYAWRIGLSYQSGYPGEYYSDKGRGYSVRCLKD